MKTLHFVFFVTAACLLAACSKPEAPQEPVRSVKLVLVSSSDLQDTTEYAGEVRARVESQPGFRVPGKLIERLVEPGQRVRKGQLLARMDPQDYALASQAAQAQQAAASTQRDLAAADLRRFTDLRRRGFVSDAEIERRKASLDAAEAALRQAQAQLAVQGNQASYTRLMADADGLVTAVLAEVGQVVAAGAPVLRVAQDGAREVWTSVPEDRLKGMHLGQSAQVRLWADQAGGQSGTLAATVREIAGSADRATRTYAVKFSLPAAADVPLGATAYVRVNTVVADGHRPVAGVRLPSSALLRSGDVTTVWVFDPQTQTVGSRPVQVVTADGNDVVVAGLEAGLEVVAAGVHVLSPGQKVVRFAAPVQQ
ncbi:MAG: efflux RND transporter periplasmic adaptor subunit [Burkholderiaceae bacterium]